MTTAPLVTVAVPSFNHAGYLDEALESIVRQDIPVEIFLADGGSTDRTPEVIRKWEGHLAGWRCHPDEGQSHAINECIAKGTAPFVCWLNSDDWLLPGAFNQLIQALQADAGAPAAYGRTWNHIEKSGRRRPVWVRPFSEYAMARFCIISQPATLIRRGAWEAVGGLDERLHMAMDYDLWWRLYKTFGPLRLVDAFLAVNRDHEETKTIRNRRLHYREAIEVVRRHYGRVPWKWWLAQPYSVWFRSLVRR